ncbi:MAG: helix-turn-helix transcriptional regulator [Deltaproteobacteria bacterium]
MAEIKRLIGDQIRRLRKEMGLSQEGLAWKAGMHYTYIGAIERGEKNWSIGTLSRIAEGLGVGINELFDLAPSQQTPDKSSVMIMKELQKCRPEFLQLFLDLIKGINALQNRKTAKGD